MKRVFLYLFILAGLILPCHLHASDIALIGNIPTDSLIDSIALSPGTGTAFGIDKEKKILYIIDVNSHFITEKVSLGRRPVGIAVNPSNNIAFITLKSNGFYHKKGSLCTVDSSGTVLSTFSIHGDPHGIAVNPINNTVVIALEKDKKLLVLSADSLQLLQEIPLPFKPRLVALDTDSNRAVVTAGEGHWSWWQHIIMIVDLNTGGVTNTIKLRRGVKGVAVDTGKDIAVTTGLKEINLFDIDTGSILSNIKDGDNILFRLKLKGISDDLKPGDKDIYDEDDIDTDINRFLNRFRPEIDDSIVKDLKKAGSGLSAFQTDYTYGLDINQSTHIAVITGEESLLLLDLNTNTLNEYQLDDIRQLRAVAVDKYKNTALVSYLEHTGRRRSVTGVLEIQLPNNMLYIASIDPSEAKAGTQDLTVNISGAGFSDAATIFINNAERNCTYISDTKLQITITAEDLKTPGQIEIKASNPDPGGGVSNTVIFTVLNPDTEPPVINITSPQNGAVLYSSPATVSGTVDDNAVSVHVNGIQASIINNTFSATVPLEDEENIITAIATDQYGRTGTSSITVTLTTKGSVAGTVTSALTGLAVSSAAVTVTDSFNNTYSAVTDGNGGYSFSSIESGVINIIITETGYNPYTYIGTLSAGQTLSVNAALTAIPPVISNIAVNTITSDSAVITWTTDQPSDSLVEYGQTTAYGSLASDLTITTNHTVALTGLIPSATYHNRITSRSENGASATSSDFIFQTEGQVTIAITITSPTDGSAINSSEVMVKGYITNITGNETGVNVNGIIAALANNEFAVNHVPLTEGSNTITVTAVDIAGTTVTKSITVNAVPAADYIRISANFESGVSAFETTLKVEGTFDFTQEPVVTSTGANPLDFLNSLGDSQYQAGMTQTGIYYFTAQAADSQGNTYTDTIAIVVYDQAILDALLKAKWNGMKTALMNNNIESALNYFHESSKEKYQEIFNLLINEISGIASAMRDIEMVSSKDIVTKFRIKREETIQGQTYDITYHIYFVKDLDGLWKIESF